MLKPTGLRMQITGKISPTIERPTYLQLARNEVVASEGVDKVLVGIATAAVIAVLWLAYVIF